MPLADVRRFERSIRGSLGAAAALLFWDGAMMGTMMLSAVFCPIWMLVSVLRSTTHRPGWGLATVRVAIPFATLVILRVNDDVQYRIADANAHRVVAACEAYRAAQGEFPRKLHQLVPKYLDSVPVAKHCLGPPSAFFYSNSHGDHPVFFWQVLPPYGRKTYDFQTRTWGYLD